MKDRRYSLYLIALVLVAVVASADPVAAALLKLGSTPTEDAECEDDSEDDCSEDSSTSGPNGDPKTCDWEPGQTGLDHLQCLGEQICGGSGHTGGVGVDYGIGDLPNMHSTMSENGNDCAPPPNPGPEDEVFSFCFRETGDTIGYVRIEVEQPDLVAKIHKFVEKPARVGEIEILVNDDFVVVDVGPAGGSHDRLNKLVCEELGKNRRVDCLDDFFVIYADSRGQTPRILSLYTAVDGVSTTEIALEPVGGRLDVTACSDPSRLSLQAVPRCQTDWDQASWNESGTTILQGPR